MKNEILQGAVTLWFILTLLNWLGYDYKWFKRQLKRGK